MWKINNLSKTILLMQICKDTDTRWIIKVIRVYTSETNGDTANSTGINAKITIYYI